MFCAEFERTIRVSGFKVGYRRPMGPELGGGYIYRIDDDQGSNHYQQCFSERAVELSQQTGLYAALYVVAKFQEGVRERHKADNSNE